MSHGHLMSLFIA